MGKARRISTRALACGAAITTASFGIATTAQALPPNRYQFFPANTNPGAVSSSCATLLQSYDGRYRASGQSETVFAVAKHRCNPSGTAGGVAYVYQYGSSRGKLRVNEAKSASASVRLSSLATSGSLIQGRCSLYDAPGNTGPNHYNHYMECVSRY